MIRKLQKISLLIFLLYLTWFKEAYYSVEYIQYISIGILTVLVILEGATQSGIRKIKLNNFFVTFAAFGLYVFLSGLMIAKNQPLFFVYIARYLVFFIVCLDCIYIYNREQSMQWLFQIILICAIFCAVQTILAGASYNNGIRVTTMSRHNNPNKLGMIIVLGTFSLLQDYERFNKRLFINFILLAAFSYTVILTASRKMFLALVVLIVMWAIRFFRTEVSGRCTWRKGVGIFLLLASGVGVIYFFVNNYSSTALFARMGFLSTGSYSLDSRAIMYKEAVQLWLEHPFFGIGYAQFGEYTSTHYIYSHSTYAEILSCTGAIGTVLFFAPLINELIKSIKLVAKAPKRDNSEKIYKYSMLVAFFVVELFLGTTQILIYEIEQMIALTILFVEIDHETKQMRLSLQEEGRQ